MIVIIGLVVLIAAVVVAVAAVAGNAGGAHAVGDHVTIFGQHLHGLSAGQLVLGGIVVGVVGMLGLSMLLGAFTRRMASRRARRELQGSRTESQALRLDRDRLARQIDAEHPALLTGDSAAVPARTDTAAAADPQPPEPSISTRDQSREPVLDLAEHPAIR